MASGSSYFLYEDDFHGVIDTDMPQNDEELNS